MKVEPEIKPEYKFWEKEEPEIIEKNGLIWRFYPKAKKLQITRIDYYRNGETRYRTITLDSRAITPDAVALLENFLIKVKESEKK